jgi:hypothetical protein
MIINQIKSYFWFKKALAYEPWICYYESGAKSLRKASSLTKDRHKKPQETAKQRSPRESDGTNSEGNHRRV